MTNERLSRYLNDAAPNPAADTEAVDLGDDPGHADRVAAQLAMADDEDDETECVDCGATAEFDDPSAVLGSDSLPAKPLCRPCILERA